MVYFFENWIYNEGFVVMVMSNEIVVGKRGIVKKLMKNYRFFLELFYVVYFGWGMICK